MILIIILNTSIWHIDETLTSIITQDQHGPGSNGYKGLTPLTSNNMVSSN